MLSLHDLFNSRRCLGRLLGCFPDHTLFFPFIHSIMPRRGERHVYMDPVCQYLGHLRYGRRMPLKRRIVLAAGGVVVRLNSCAHVEVHKPGSRVVKLIPSGITPISPSRTPLIGRR